MDDNSHAAEQAKPEISSTSVGDAPDPDEDYLDDLDGPYSPLLLPRV